MVIKDLIKGDGALQELDQTYTVISSQEKQLDIYHEVDSLKNSKIKSLNQILLIKEEQFKLEREKSLNLQKELKQKNNQNLFLKAGIGASLVAILASLLK